MRLGGEDEMCELLHFFCARALDRQGHPAVVVIESELALSTLLSLL